MSSSYGMRLGVGDPAVDVEAERSALRVRDLDHAGRQVRHRAASRDPGLDQVEQEEPGAAAELERPVVGPSAAPRRATMASNLPLA